MKQGSGPVIDKARNVHFSFLFLEKIFAKINDDAIDKRDSASSFSLKLYALE